MDQGKISKKKKLFFARRFETTSKQKCSNVRPLLSITYPLDSESLNILDIRLWEVGAKRRLKRTSKVKNERRKKTFFCAVILDNFKQKCSYLRPLLSITFPQGLRISKNIGHTTSGSGGKKIVKRYLKSEKSEQKKNFFCAAILDNLQTKLFISETTSFHYFSPRIPNL